MSDSEDASFTTDVLVCGACEEYLVDVPQANLVKIYCIRCANSYLCGDCSRDRAGCPSCKEPAKSTASISLSVKVRKAEKRQPEMIEPEINPVKKMRRDGNARFSMIMTTPAPVAPPAEIRENDVEEVVELPAGERRLEDYCRYIRNRSNRGTAYEIKAKRTRWLALEEYLEAGRIITEAHLRLRISYTKIYRALGTKRNFKHYLACRLLHLLYESSEPFRLVWKHRLVMPVPWSTFRDSATLQRIRGPMIPHLNAAWSQIATTNLLVE